MQLHGDHATSRELDSVALPRECMITVLGV